MRAIRLGILCAVPFCVGLATTPLAAQADSDACAVLTPAQIGAAVGTPVAAGQYVTPTFKRTCTWTTSGKTDVKFVTLYLQTAAAFDGGKQMAAMMAGASGGKGKVQSGGVGDDSYYFVAGTQVGLLVKKGSRSFKVAVYATLPVDKKEAMELTLAKEALAKL